MFADTRSPQRSLNNEFDSAAATSSSSSSSTPHATTSSIGTTAADATADADLGGDDAIVSVEDAAKLDGVTLESLVSSGVLAEMPKSAEELLAKLKKSKALRSALLAR